MEDTWPSFSPNRPYLEFARKYLDTHNWTPGRQFLLMKSGNGKAQQLTNDPRYDHCAFTWSTEGDRPANVRFNQSALKKPTEILLMENVTYWNPAWLIVDTPHIGFLEPQWLK